MSDNLLILMSDEHQARAMSCRDHPVVQTPNLDALAARGTTFTNAYTPSPICVPARASFATGLYVHQTRLWDNAMPYSGQIPGWGHALQAGGVPVESIGKLHYRAAEDPAGFDTEHIPMMVAGGTGMVWASIRKGNERVLMPSRMLGDYIGPGESKYTEYDAAVVRQTRDWLAAAPDRPWCLYVGLVAPHFPLVVPPEFFELYPTADLPPAKLHPTDGHRRHPWVELQSDLDRSEDKFRDPQERLAAMSAYFGLCTWLDHNVGEILDALDANGLAHNTTVVYTSDHGDNVGARGLWGKSNMYEESAAIPLIMAEPGQAASVCDVSVSLLDLAATIPDHFGLPFENQGPGSPLHQLAASPIADRAVFSEYHAAGAVSGAFMLRKSRWKLIHYVGFEPELFDLAEDPEELSNLAGDPDYADILDDLSAELRGICDPEATDAMAHADQAQMIERYGGREAALKLGAPAATPPPDLTRA
ncbi:MAG: sulfatase-like hydrolase/transferase [Pseudomonadota bacterium]